MLTKSRYSLKDMLLWTRWELLVFLIGAAAVTALYTTFDLSFLRLPWAPVAVIGTAVAFIVGFQNNAAYGRIWEARKIWGGIVNTSRTWGMKTRDMVTNEYAKEPASDEELVEIRETLVHRHIAWMAALRHAMRMAKPWEEFVDPQQRGRHYTTSAMFVRLLLDSDADDLAAAFLGFLADLTSLSHALAVAALNGLIIAVCALARDWSATSDGSTAK